MKPESEGGNFDWTTKSGKVRVDSETRGSKIPTYLTKKHGRRQLEVMDLGITYLVGKVGSQAPT